MRAADVRANVVAALLPSATNPVRASVVLGLALAVTAALLLPFVTLSGFARRDSRVCRGSLPRADKARALLWTFFAPGLLEENRRLIAAERVDILLYVHRTDARRVCERVLRALHVMRESIAH